MKTFKGIVSELTKVPIKVVLPTREVKHFKNWLKTEFFNIEPDTVESISADTSEIIFSIYGSKFSLENSVLKDIKKLFKKAFVEI